MRRLTLLVVLALGLAACGGGSGASKDAVKITFGRGGGTMVPYSITIAPGGKITTTGNLPATAMPALTSAQDADLSSRVQRDFPKLKSESCPGTFPDESAMFITALGKTVTVRGTCEPGFTKLWNALTSATTIFVTHG